MRSSLRAWTKCRRIARHRRSSSGAGWETSRSRPRGLPSGPNAGGTSICPSSPGPLAATTPPARSGCHVGNEIAREGRPHMSHVVRACMMGLAGLATAAAASARQPAPAARPEVAKKVAEVEQVAARGPFAPNWTSLAAFTVPEWYEDAKFGIFIHWGLYSVPAFGNEWYPRNMYKQDEKAFAHHVATYGPQSRFGYKDFIPRFTAEHFDATQWVALFKAAGARYIVPVAEHHDGFAMYDSDMTRWSAAKMGPKRDIIGELAKAVRAEGLVFGLSSHRVEHWWFFDQGRTFDSDVRDPANAEFYGPAVNRKTSEAQKTPPDRAFL